MALCLQRESDVVAANSTFQELGDQEDLEEYVGCKIMRDFETQALTFTQPVLIRSYLTGFDLTDETGNPTTPA